ncbi:MAG: ATP-binding protein [Saprospirales bacterium]|nr:ATP-binding protein [Saprospirales bacterium]
MNNKPPYRIAITGPESTGKTTLAMALAERFRTAWVREYSREYLDGLGRPYEFEDLEQIARGQRLLEEEGLREANRFLFCDTDMLVMKVWSEYRFGKCAPYILEALQNDPYDLHLLCGTDVPWEYDPLRENPGEREELYQIYRSELIRMGGAFLEVRGGEEERVEVVTDYLNARFSFIVTG